MNFCSQPAARAASQKLHALYEPEEPGRREFIEGLLRYWEEKEVPLKNAPLMGRKTLDLFRLYHVIKDRGGMQEVNCALFFYASLPYCMASCKHRKSEPHLLRFPTAFCIIPALISYE